MLFYSSASSRSAKPRSLWALLGQAFLILLLLRGTALAAPVVSPHLRVAVPAGGGLIDLVDFPLPDACATTPCAAQRVMLAKFVVNEPTTDLSFELRPVNPALVTKYPVTPFTTAGGGSNVSIPDNDLGVPAASVRARFTTDACAAGFRVLTLLVRFDNANSAFPVGEKWKIQVNPVATLRSYYGFNVDGAVETAADALVTKPYLINNIPDAQLGNFASFADFGSLTTLAFGDVPINLGPTYAPKRSYAFRNVGTGPLTVSGVTPAAWPAGGCTAVGYPPSTVEPMDPHETVITCNPTTVGAITDPNVTITTNAGPLQLHVQARGIQVRTAIVMDLSGSMLWDRQDNYTTVATEQKIYFARSAAYQLATLYKSLLPKAEMGLISYPALSGVCPSAQQLIHVDPGNIVDNWDGFNFRLNDGASNGLLLTPPHADTPLAEGIKEVLGVLHPNPPIANTRAAVFLFGDGEHNCNSAAPKPTPDLWYPDLVSDGIPFFTIPYGKGQPQWVQTYSTIASKSGGQMFSANLSDTNSLATQFKDALAKALELETLKDPAASISAGASASHGVCANSSANQLVFSVHWANNDSNAVQVTVETPDHTLLTPASVAANPGHVSYEAGQMFANYVVRGKYLQGDAAAGVWKIHVKGNQTTPYVYQVFAMDQMKTVATLDWSHLEKAANLEVKFPGGAYAVAAASVVTRVEKPTVSLHNYLAKTPVNPALIARIPENLAQHWGPAEKKLYALNQSGKPFDPRMVVEEKRAGELDSVAVTEVQVAAEARPRASGTVVGTRPRVAASAAPPSPALNKAMIGVKTPWADKAYQIPLEVAKVDGLHNVVVSVNGILANGQCFEREYSFSRFLDVFLTVSQIVKTTRWEEVQMKPFFPKSVEEIVRGAVPEGMVRKAITLAPADDAGNVFGMGRASEITLGLQEAEALGPLVDNYDGSYTQIVQYKRGARPTVQASVGDVKTDAIPEEAATAPGPGAAPEAAGLGWRWIALIILLLVAVLLFLRFRKK